MKLKIYIDEAGRGPLAGPLYVGAVLPRQRFTKKHYKDSKILSERQREELFAKIQILEQKNQIIYGYGIVSSREIDLHGMTKALQFGVLRAVQMVLQKLYTTEISQQLGKVLCSCDAMQGIKLQNLFLEKENVVEAMPQIADILKDFGLELELSIDGNKTFGVDQILGCPVITIIHGDALIPEISMASIIAKVLRDHEMIKLDKDYPQYNFAQHKGYGTQEHRDLIAEHGPSDIHRKLFLKEYFPEFKKQPKKPKQPKKVSRLPRKKKPQAEKLF
ncbi:MAG: ribonuclease HII [Candidatus Absconditabacteria bacterium]|nr:ribonuclease HII [Candidatus Absconditabacteria bacterium]